MACRLSAADLVSPPTLSLSLSLLLFATALSLLAKVSAAPVALGEKHKVSPSMVREWEQDFK